MKRIYFDKNIYSKLNTYTEFSELTEKLINSKVSTTFLFSDAHIEDLLRDETELKYSDLEFMERFTNGNYIHLSNYNLGCSIGNKTPIEVFNSKQMEISAKDFDFDIDTNKITEQILRISGLDLKNETVDESKRNFSNIIPINPSEEEKEILDILGINNNEYGKEEWVEKLNEISDKIRNEIDLYKILRRLSIKDLGQDRQRILIDDLGYEDKLKESKVGKSLSEIVNIFTEPLSKIPFVDKCFMEYTTRYMTMNMLGIDGEKNRKAVFVNTETDSHHSFYGIFSDIFVSADEGLIKKTKELYKFYSIETRVLTFEEFKDELEQLTD